MNATQLKYAREKVNEIFYEKQKVISEQYQIPHPSKEETLKALREGRFTVKDNLDVGKYIGGYLSDYVVIDTGVDVEVLKAKLNGATISLNKAKARILDELILGDADGALELLNKFREMEF